MSYGEYCLIGINDPGVVDLPQVNRWGEIERTVGAQQVGLDLLIVRVDEGRTEPVASGWARHVHVHVLFARMNAADLSTHVGFRESTGREVLRERGVVRRYDRIA